MNTDYKCLQTVSICYIFFAIDDVIVTSVNTYTSMMAHWWELNSTEDK